MRRAFRVLLAAMMGVGISLRAQPAPPGLVPLTESGRSIVVSTRGTEVTIVRVAIPTAVRRSAFVSRRPVPYRVIPGRFLHVLGASSGVVDVAEDSTLVIALRVSRMAPAGRTFGGTVEFSEGTNTHTVAVALDIPVARRLTMATAGRALVASPGKWNTLTVRVQNDGNVDERPTLQVAVPRGWRSEVRPNGTVTLGASSASDRSIRIWVPPHTGSGLVLVPLTLSGADGSVTTEQLQVDVVTASAKGAEGALVTTSVVSGRTADMKSATGYAVSIAGLLTDSTSIGGHFMHAGAAGDGGPSAVLLARSGVMSAPPSVDIRNRAFQLSAGATSALMPELAGQFLAGTGAVTGASGKRWVGRGYALQPTRLANGPFSTRNAPGRMQGGELGYNTAHVRTSVFGASLRDPVTHRALDAYGVRAIVGTVGEQVLHTELAYRGVGDTRGVGVSTQYQRSGRASNIDLRLLHAPGGSRGFARAANELNAAASRTVGRLGYASVGGWLQDDNNADLGAVRNSGWYLTPAVNVSRVGTVGLDVRGVRFGTSAGGTRLASNELTTGGLVSTSVLGTALMARSMLARIDRSVANAPELTTGGRHWRLDHSVSTLRPLSNGTLQANWSYQQFSGTMGVLPSQQAYMVRLDGVRPKLEAPFRVEAEVQHLRIDGQAAPLWTARAAATIELPGAMALTFAAERNPFLSVLRNGRQQQVVYTMRLDRTSAMRRLFSTTRGRAFRDENDNGMLDDGEVGVAGVVIKCGAVRAVTDTKGRYACNERDQTVDTRSIPTGLVVSNAQVTVGTPIALRVVQPLRIILHVRASDSAMVSRSLLGQAIVTARDATGAQWYARATGDGEFRLDALPFGRYTIGVDASAIEEPLSSSETTVEIDKVEPELVRIELRARPMRIRTFAAPAPSEPRNTTVQPAEANRNPTLNPTPRPSPDKTNVPPGRQ